jgi:hypothetical protein
MIDENSDIEDLICRAGHPPSDVFIPRGCS